MTKPEFVKVRQHRPCGHCGITGVETELNPNNNGLPGPTARIAVLSDRGVRCSI